MTTRRHCCAWLLASVLTVSYYFVSNQTENSERSRATSAGSKTLNLPRACALDSFAINNLSPRCGNYIFSLLLQCVCTADSAFFLRKRNKYR